jgi:hypothetical protein
MDSFISPWRDGDQCRRREHQLIQSFVCLPDASDAFHYLLVGLLRVLEQGLNVAIPADGMFV